MILSRVDEELTHEKAVRIRSAVEEAKSTADVKARKSLHPLFSGMRQIRFLKPRFLWFPFQMRK